MALKQLQWSGIGYCYNVFLVKNFHKERPRVRYIMNQKRSFLSYLSSHIVSGFKHNSNKLLALILFTMFSGIVPFSVSLRFHGMFFLHK